MEGPPAFVEEIEFEELQFCEVVGRGAFGVVSRAIWRNIVVAVKLIETESEKKAFKTELTQLSRVNHPNIVRLYGACTKHPVCLVMEYAEGGSLYNVLHGEGPQPDYSTSHAMSWALQCANGVAYLHDMKPKPLVHRDLKPPNLLLVAGGTVLKICDFGTACDAHTHMTNNKGSAAWMAPEVFEGSNYSEKCDVFSFGIILWEVLTRRKPFDEVGGPAFRIMWAVHNGKRPPLIANCPKSVEVLMTRCWSSNPMERPSMGEVYRIMAHLYKFFHGGDQPLRYPNQSEEPDTPTAEAGMSSSVYDTPPPTNQTHQGTTIRDTVRHALRELGEPVPIVPATPKSAPVVVEEDNPRRTSAPASLAASRESLLDGKTSRSSTPSADFINKRYSADLSKLEESDILSHAAKSAPANQQKSVKGHRRSGSYGTTFISPSSNLLGPNWSPKAVRGHRRTGSYGNTPIVTSSSDVFSYGTPLHHTTTAPSNLGGNTTRMSGDVLPLGNTTSPVRSVSWTLGERQQAPQEALPVVPGGEATGDLPTLSSGENAALNLALATMDNQLQPLTPCPTSPDSMAIYNQHIEVANEYLRVQTEIALLTQRQHELSQELQRDEKEHQDSQQLVHEYQQLMSENESLTLLYNNMKKQVEVLRQQQSKRYGAG